MIVQIADDHFFGGIHDRQCHTLVDQPKFTVDLGGMLLDQAEGTQEGAREADSGDREILFGSGCLGAIESTGWYFHRPHGIFFSTGGRHFFVS